MSSKYVTPGYQAKPLPAAIYSPIPTPFKEGSEEVDVDALVRHARRLATAGIGLVVSGSTGEAIAMSNDERAAAVYHIRTELQKHGLDTPIIAGTGGGSLRETIKLSHEAADAGADAVIVISPGYFSSSLASDKAALKQFFTTVADQSRIPVMIYNFPAAAGGIDMDSDLLEDISAHPNICGAKLTCAGVGKAGRLANSKNVKGRNFHVFPGFADIIFPCMTIGSTGAIVGTANLVPRMCANHHKDIQQYFEKPDAELLKSIQQEQDILSRADRALAKAGVVATKWAVDRYYYPMGVARKPLQPVPSAVQAQLSQDLVDILLMERKLEQAAGVKTDTQKS